LIYAWAKTFRALPAAVGQDFRLRVVAHLARELGQVLRVVVELVAVEPLQPAGPAHLGQVLGDHVVVELRPRHQPDLGLHAPHVTAL
jgi:hypothetical protein